MDERGSFVVKFSKERSVWQAVDVSDETAKVKYKELVEFCETPRSRDEICEFLNLKSKTYVVKEYVIPLVERGVLRMTIPDRPRSSNQRYVANKADNR